MPLRGPRETHFPAIEGIELIQAFSSLMPPSIAKRFQAYLKQSEIANIPIWRVAETVFGVSQTHIRTILAQHYGLREVNLTRRTPRAEASSSTLASRYLELGCLPFQRIGQTDICAIVDPEKRLQAQAALNLSNPVFLVASEQDLQAAILRLYTEHLTQQAQGDTAIHPFSSRMGIALWQKYSLLGLFSCIGIAPFFWTSWGSAFLLFILSFSALLGVGLRLWVISMGWYFNQANKTNARELKGISDTIDHLPSIQKNSDPNILPVVTILVPICLEAEILPVLIEALERLDYPQPCLQILLLIEVWDTKTLKAALALALPPHIQIVKVPKGKPHTKPRAMNFALPLVRGQILTVFDAEDRPEPDQIHKAVQALQNGDKKLACVQAKLNFYNHYESLIPKLFSAEYAVWFDYILPAMAKCNLAIPLGGTSFYIRTEQLRELKGWDAWNVTEDAELGYRLMRAGYHCQTLDSTTYEEAMTVPISWIRQRSRWLKGFLFPLKSHSRLPWKMYQELGWSSSLSAFILLFLPVLNFLLLPFIWVAFLGSLVQMMVGKSLIIGSSESMQNILFISMGSASLAMFLLYSFAVLRRFGWQRLWVAFFFWLYWPMASIAAFKAVAELFIAPYYWDKTQHCVTEAAQKMRLAGLAAARKRLRRQNFLKMNSEQHDSNE